MRKQLETNQNMCDNKENGIGEILMNTKNRMLIGSNTIKETSRLLYAILHGTKAQSTFTDLFNLKGMRQAKSKASVFFNIPEHDNFTSNVYAKLYDLAYCKVSDITIYLKILKYCNYKSLNINQISRKLNTNLNEQPDLLHSKLVKSSIQRKVNILINAGYLRNEGTDGKFLLKNEPCIFDEIELNNYQMRQLLFATSFFRNVVHPTVAGHAFHNTLRLYLARKHSFNDNNITNISVFNSFRFHALNEIKMTILNDCIKNESALTIEYLTFNPGNPDKNLIKKLIITPVGIKHVREFGCQYLEAQCHSDNKKLTLDISLILNIEGDTDKPLLIDPIKNIIANQILINNISMEHLKKPLAQKNIRVSQLMAISEYSNLIKHAKYFAQTPVLFSKAEMKWFSSMLTDERIGDFLEKDFIDSIGKALHQPLSLTTNSDNLMIKINKLKDAIERKQQIQLSVSGALKTVIPFQIGYDIDTNTFSLYGISQNGIYSTFINNIASVKPSTNALTNKQYEEGRSLFYETVKISFTIRGTTNKIMHALYLFSKYDTIAKPKSISLTTIVYQFSITVLRYQEAFLRKDLAKLSNIDCS